VPQTTNIKNRLFKKILTIGINWVKIRYYSCKHDKCGSNTCCHSSNTDFNSQLNINHHQHLSSLRSPNNKQNKLHL